VPAQSRHLRTRPRTLWRRTGRSDQSLHQTAAMPQMRQPQRDGQAHSK
jgi:hypothetical protein